MTKARTHQSDTERPTPASDPLPEVVAAAAVASRTFYTVQVRYRRSDWVSLDSLSDRMLAVRRAALAYRTAACEDGSLPQQVRVVATQR
jgi:hypothetical protein